jgi:hypothetical protein
MSCDRLTPPVLSSTASSGVNVDLVDHLSGGVEELVRLTTPTATVAGGSHARNDPPGLGKLQRIANRGLRIEWGTG